MRLKISNFQLMKQMLASVADDNLMLPWNAYPCLLWPRTTNRGGYAMALDGKHPRSVHRLAFEIAVGPIPDGCDICHHCDKPPCFRPIHLFAGTENENIQDSIAKGRFRRALGENHGNAKLDNDSILAIRRLYAAGGITQRALAQRFDTKQSVIWAILARTAWKHVG